MVIFHSKLLLYQRLHPDSLRGHWSHWISCRSQRIPRALGFLARAQVLRLGGEQITHSSQISGGVEQGERLMVEGWIPSRHLTGQSMTSGSIMMVSITGWWFQTCFMFHNIWDVILPIDYIIFFQDGYCTTNQIRMYKWNPQNPMALFQLFSGY